MSSLWDWKQSPSHHPISVQVPSLIKYITVWLLALLLCSNALPKATYRRTYKRKSCFGSQFKVPDHHGREVRAAGT